MKRKIILATATLALAATALVGCGDKMQEQFKDAGIDGRNETPADLVNMPDGFSNVATKCDNGNRIYVIFKGDSAYGSIDVVSQDPTCRN